jgi:hypothetical protein
LNQEILKPTSETATRKPSSIQHPDSHFASLWDDSESNWVIYVG